MKLTALAVVVRARYCKRASGGLDSIPLESCPQLYAQRTGFHSDYEAGERCAAFVAATQATPPLRDGKRRTCVSSVAVG